jgi:molybdopterin-containing oxidoreductase family iron-sulfur binding subunit
MQRRGFLKIAGLGVAGACVPVAAALARAAGMERAPGAFAGKRWALVVDSRKCAQKDGCDACIQACHKAHNVPALNDPRHEVKWIWKEPYERVFPDQVHALTSAELRTRKLMVLCNHCDNPPCVRVCPTQATWKRGDGLVIVDEHRCIGCRYCLTACPYGARSFNWQDPRPAIAAPNPDYPTRTKGVVEKCNFCMERLAVGERPLCVDACEKANCGALIFGDVGDPASPVSALLRTTNVARRKPGLGTAPHVFYIL